MTHTGEQIRFFPHERLAAWEMARDAVAMVHARRARLRKLPGRLGEQLERAVIGAASNLCAAAGAEGADARRQFRIALSECSEAGGCAELAHALGGLDDAEHAALRAALLRLGACLRGLTR